MKARIVKKGNFWFGEVYAHWITLFKFGEKKSWRSVTKKCYTEFGARRELEKWKKENC